MIIYLSAPYTDPNRGVMERRAAIITRAAAQLLDQGHIVFSPVTHGAAVAQHLSGEKSHGWWMRQCIALLNALATQKDFVLWVLPLPGWRDSRGVTMEISWAQAGGHPWLIDNTLYAKARVRLIIDTQETRGTRP